MWCINECDHQKQINLRRIITNGRRELKIEIGRKCVGRMKCLVGETGRNDTKDALGGYVCMCVSMN